MFDINAIIYVILYLIFFHVVFDPHLAIKVLSVVWLSSNVPYSLKSVERKSSFSMLKLFPLLRAISTFCGIRHVFN